MAAESYNKLLRTKQGPIMINKLSWSTLTIDENVIRNNIPTDRGVLTLLTKNIQDKYDSPVNEPVKRWNENIDPDIRQPTPDENTDAHGSLLLIR